MDLCIDTQILVLASTASGSEHLALLIEFQGCERLKIALDQFVAQEYNKQMRADRFGQVWLLQMLKRNRVVYRERVKLDKPTSTALRDLHFSSDDLKFVLLTLATETKKLVSEDDDYSAGVKKILRNKHSMAIHSCAEAREFVKANLGDSSVSGCS